MAIQGSLETFSLPELFQIFESGAKSGKLSFTPSSKDNNSELEGFFELWFDKGNFVTIVNSLDRYSLSANIQSNNWIEFKVLIRAKHLSDKDLPFAIYLRRQGLLTPRQIDSLFQTQLDLVRRLFDVESAWFDFEEIDKDSELFPMKEMTGRQKRPAELSIEAMRDISNWQRFEEDFPTAISGLRKLTDEHQMQLVSLEEKVWNYADGNVALKTIAKETSTSLEEIQRIALSMILAGILEEVPVAGATVTAKTPKFSSHRAYAENGNVALKSEVKSQASSSLINNLVSFLKNNF